MWKIGEHFFLFPKFGKPYLRINPKVGQSEYNLCTSVYIPSILFDSPQ